MKKIYQAIILFGNAIKKAANQAGDFLNGLAASAGAGVSGFLIPPGKNGWYISMLRWLGSMLKGISDVTGASIKGIFNMMGGIIAGLFEMAGGIFTFNLSLVLKGLLDVFSPIAGILIVVSGRILSLFQTLILIQNFERKLEESERDQLHKVFRNSIRYKRIRIIEGRSGLFGLNARAFTLGDTIFLKKSRPAVDLLVHECTHIWQYQNLGVSYSGDALGAQFFIRDAYNWEREIHERGKKEWLEFNMESQAEFLQDLWLKGRKTGVNGSTLQGQGAFFDIDWGSESGIFTKSGKDYTLFARQAERDIRNV